MKRHAVPQSEHRRRYAVLEFTATVAVFALALGMVALLLVSA